MDSLILNIRLLDEEEVQDVKEEKKRVICKPKVFTFSYGHMEASRVGKLRDGYTPEDYTPTYDMSVSYDVLLNGCKPTKYETYLAKLREEVIAEKEAEESANAVENEWGDVCKYFTRKVRNLFVE